MNPLDKSRDDNGDVNEVTRVTPAVKEGKVNRV